MNPVRVILAGLLLTAVMPAGTAGTAPWCTSGCTDSWYKKAVNIPRISAGGAPVLIAVIDDGFNLSHPAIKPFLYENPRERLANGTDDDANGFVDDRCGWDVSDRDNDVRFPAGQEQFFYHGTYLAGIITAMLRSAAGDAAPDLFKIIPVKALADRAERAVMADGYRGLAYAAATEARVICCAWSGGVPEEHERDGLAAVLKKGRTVVASAGNEYTADVSEPARTGGVIAVSAVDRNLVKPDFANYGMRVDLCAPGADICGPAAGGDSTRLTCRGTSPATAIVTAAAAILASRFPSATTAQIVCALKNTAVPVDAYNTRLAGRLGAGMINIGAALAYLDNRDDLVTAAAVPRPQGTLVFHGSGIEDYREWTVAPAGAYKGFRFIMNDYTGPETSGILSFFTGGSSEPAVSAAPDALPADLYVLGDSVRVRFEPEEKSKNLAWEMSFAADVIDSGVLYCRGTERYTENTGTITDGSGQDPYANYTSCKWQLAVPEDKRITLLFSAFDTQPNVDFVYLFDGENTTPRTMLAKFSGHSRPPRITSRTSRVLVWFVTDGDTTGDGWILQYRAQ